MARLFLGDFACALAELSRPGASLGLVQLPCFSEASLFGALDADRSQADRTRLAEAFYREVERRAAIDPAAVRCRWRIHSLLVRKLPSPR